MHVTSKTRPFLQSCATPLENLWNKITLKSMCQGIFHNLFYHARNKDDIGDIVDQALQEATMIRKETGNEIIQDIFQDGSLQQSTVNMTRQDNSASANTAQDEVTVIGFHKSGTRKRSDISGNCDIKHAPDQGGKFYC